jgi:hypothetical protein
MGGRDWSIANDAFVGIRLPDDLKLALEVLSVKHCLTLSNMIRKVLDRDPEVSYVAARLRDMTEAPQREGTSP